VSVAIVLLTIALILVVALLAAAGAAMLARLDGATYPAAFQQAALTFATMISLAAAVTAALSSVRS